VSIDPASSTNYAGNADAVGALVAQRSDFISFAIGGCRG
jgi:hypothetical protein